MKKLLLYLKYFLVGSFAFSLFSIQSLYAEGYGFAYGDRPTAAAYVPTALYSFNSKGTLFITRLGVGNYKVRFSGITPSEGRYGNVQVSSNGKGNSQCQIEGWSVVSDLEAIVKCYSYKGEAKDEYFTILAFIPPMANSNFAYVWANNPSSDSYVPSTLYSYNPSGGDILIQRKVLGQYKVIFRNLKSKLYKGGHVQITPYGSTFSYCKVQDWSLLDADVSIDVTCYDKFGQPQDGQFSAYIIWSNPSTHFSSSYALANLPTTLSYTPNDFYASPSGTIIERLAIGSYRVKFNAVGHHQADNYQTFVQITPFGTTNYFCKVRNWNRATPKSATDTMDIYVDCYYPDRETKVDTNFSVIALYPYHPN